MKKSSMIGMIGAGCMAIFLVANHASENGLSATQVMKGIVSDGKLPQKVTQQEEESDIKPSIYEKVANYLEKNLPNMFEDYERPVDKLVARKYPGSEAVSYSGEFYNKPEKLLDFLASIDYPDLDDVAERIDNGEEALFEKALVTVTTEVTTANNLHFFYDFEVTVYAYIQVPLRLDGYIGPVDTRCLVIDPNTRDRLEVQVGRTPEVYKRYKDAGMEEMLDYKEYLYSDEFNEQADEAAEKFVEKMFEE